MLRDLPLVLSEEQPALLAIWEQIGECQSLRIVSVGFGFTELLQPYLFSQLLTI